MSVFDHTTARRSTSLRRKYKVRRTWCEACGDDLPHRGGRYPRFCGLDCAQWALEDCVKRGIGGNESERALIREIILRYRKGILP